MMQPDLIVVLSHQEDTTARRVVHALQQRGAEVLFLDTGAFPAHISLDATFVTSRWQGALRYEGQYYDLARIKSVLVRRPTHYQVDPQAPDLVQAFLENEALKGFGGILRSLEDVLWMNPLEAHRAANFKPVQLQVASQFGLRVPRSLITNHPESVRRFFEVCDGELIYKTLHGGNVAGGGAVFHTIFTSRVTPASLEHLERVRLTAHYFQELIERALDLRVTVIGKTALTVAIQPHEEAHAPLDWRASYGNLHYQVYALPESVQQQCLQVVQRLGLTYGAIDLLLTPQQEYVFLEVNPGGQYEWLEVETGLPFSATIAEVLMQGKEGCYHA